jgi:hypothetical protein
MAKGDGSSAAVSSCNTGGFLLLPLECSQCYSTVDILQIRVSSETSFVLKQPKLEPKLVLALSETRRLFRLFRFNIETGSFVFRNNRNKQKTNRNSSKFVKISTFLIPPIISSVCFGCFDTSPKHWNKTKENIFGFANRKTTETDWVSVCFGSYREKKLMVSRAPNRERFFEIFSVCFGCFDAGPKHRNKPKQTETNRKNVFWFHKTNQKTTETDWVWFFFGLNRKKIWLFRGHPTSNTPRGSPATTGDETEQHDQPIERTKYSEHSDWSESD